MKSISEQIEPKITARMDKKYQPLFQRQARYKGNGIYFIPGTNLYSTDTRELYLMFAACKEGIKYKIDEGEEIEED